MNKIAMYETILAINPLWNKEASFGSRVRGAVGDFVGNLTGSRVAKRQKDLSELDVAHKGLQKEYDDIMNFTESQAKSKLDLMKSLLADPDNLDAEGNLNDAASKVFSDHNRKLWADEAAFSKNRGIESAYERFHELKPSTGFMATGDEGDLVGKALRAKMQARKDVKSLKRSRDLTRAGTAGVGLTAAGLGGKALYNRGQEKTAMYVRLLSDSPLWSKFFS